MGRTLLVTSALLLSTACDAAVVAQAETRTEVEAEAAAAAAVAAEADVAVVAAAPATASIELQADSFRLAEVTALVQGGTIETAEELELAVNDPAAGINRIDIDADGQVDHVEVVEVRGDARVDFEMKVIPSSRASVVHAVDLRDRDGGGQPRHQRGVVLGQLLGRGPLLGRRGGPRRCVDIRGAGALRGDRGVRRPAAAGVGVRGRPADVPQRLRGGGDGAVDPPGHLKHGHWKATGGLPPGHAKGHVGFEGHGGFGGHAKGHGKGGFDGHAKGGGSAKGGFGGGPGKGHDGGGSAKGGSGLGGPGGPKHHGGKSRGGSPAPKQSMHGGGPKGGAGPKGGGRPKGGGKGKK
ncbi:hypothetical protein OV079_52745 [Nannocystis pusilla]|uniref:Uncharacterized protein n=1 Tax=Nannocystis pusilla TaxID=889268 RepID=A0A9X3J2Q4_9BACT|nr:hypothetical protein [Nannocystis pusilla]MCY1014052.1 hypothetical protein [Nannocystis pusilla]